MSVVVANRIKLHCLVEGDSGGPPVVFVNSLGTDLHLWDALVPLLPAGLRLIRYDKRGHGRSEVPPGPYSLKDHTLDLAGLLKALAAEPAVVVGISVGGLIAMDYAIKEPECVRALVLCDTAPKIGTADGWTERIENVRARGMQEMAQAILARWISPGFADERPDDYRSLIEMLLRTPVEGYVGTCAVLRDADLRASIGEIRAQSLLICGEHDLAAPPAQMRELAAALPNARLETVPSAAHLPCVEQPQAMAGILTAFLQETYHGRR